MYFTLVLLVGAECSNCCVAAGRKRKEVSDKGHAYMYGFIMVRIGKLQCEDSEF